MRVESQPECASSQANEKKKTAFNSETSHTQMEDIYKDTYGRSTRERRENKAWVNPHNCTEQRPNKHTIGTKKAQGFCSFHPKVTFHPTPSKLKHMHRPRTFASAPPTTRRLASYAQQTKHTHIHCHASRPRTFASASSTTRRLASSFSCFLRSLCTQALGSRRFACILTSCFGAPAPYVPKECRVLAQ